MYKNILVPLDGSTLSECSLAHVKEIVKACDVPLVTLLNIVDSVHNYPDTSKEEIKINIEESVKSKANDYLKTIAESLHGISTKIVIQKGNAAEKILNYISDNGIDLVIMSTHGHSGGARFFTGSTADKVIKHSPIPVLAITPESCRI
jgi:nucleotide-binding universal stress UspA family protein